MLRFQTLDGHDLVDLCSTFNEAFANYFTKVHMDPQKLEEKILNDGVRMDLSVGAFDEDQLVGFILHAYDIKDGFPICYNAATGVIYSHRGQQLTNRMYDFAFPLLKNAGTKGCVLEVITENAPAIKVYERAGFAINRQLDCYRDTLTIKEKDDNGSIVELAGWDWEPSWQNDRSACGNSRSFLQTLAFELGGKLIAYVIYHPLQNRIVQFAVDPGHRRKGIASKLFRYLRNRMKEGTMIINVDHNDISTARFLEATGFELFLSQFEMVLEW